MITSFFGSYFGNVAGSRFIGPANHVPIRAKLLLTLRPYAFGEDVLLDDLYGRYGEDVIIEWRGRYGEDVPIMGYMIPEDMQAEMFAVLGEGLWFDAVGTAKQVNNIELSMSPEINQWSMWYRLNYLAGIGKREVFFYDPALLTDEDVAVIAAWIKEPGATSYPSALFNGVDARLATYTGGPTYAADNLGVLVSPGANRPACRGFRLDGTTYKTTDTSGNPIVASTPQKTVTYNTYWTTKTFAETFDKFDISDPLKAPGWLCEPVRTNYALNSATPATHTTGTIAAGTYTLWQDGTGSIAATAGTAVGTFGTASNGTPATITITTAGTVVLTASGTNTLVQLELGAFKTSRIYTTTAPMVRAATIASFPTAGKIPVNNFSIRMIVVPRASGQSGIYCFGSYVDSSNYTAIVVNPTSIAIRKRVADVNTDASVSITHANGVPLDLILYSSSTSGMQIAVRSFSSSWGAFTDGTANDTAAAKANAPIAATYRLGDLNGFQFTGNISLFDCVSMPSGITDPMAWAKTHWDIYSLLTIDGQSLTINNEPLYIGV